MRHTLFLRSLIGLLGITGLFAVMVTALAAPASSIAWQPSIEIATDRGERGPWQQSQSRYDFVDDPSVALTARGDAAVAWVDQARKAVLFQRFLASGKPQFEQPVDVSRRPDTFSWLPRVVLAPSAPQSVFILWQEIIFSGGSHGGDILFARSDDGGKSFSVPLNLSNSLGGDGKGRINREIWDNGSLDLVAGHGGALYAAWTEYDGQLWLSRSTDGGRRFSSPVRIAGGGKAYPARAPSLAVGPGGAVYLAWTVGDNDAADIHVARSLDGGATFSQPQLVAPSPAYSDAPRLAVDGAGVVHLVYAQSQAGPFERYGIRYTRSTDGGRSFAPPADISRPMPVGFQSAAFPALALDAGGRVVVVWELFEDAGRRPRGLGVAVSANGGRSFSRPGVVPGSVDAAGGFNGSSQGLLMNKLAVSDDGAVAVVNSSLLPGAHSRVWLMRGRLMP
ncbi:sialidase family protein [Polaromonas hydrogenivorans]|uniref:Sialidase family protein n=1 Tax=Polaromonas hydrogenivorans TaxID=335476 RepID=A0AAU7LWX0_9BURK